MDFELSMALLALWFASTMALFIAAIMFLHNSGEAFHPHSIVMDRRHQFFAVVGANTVCKTDFAVKSVSAYFAPRGSTSDKIFTVLIVLCSVAGFLGSVRWRAIEDASSTEALLAQIAFAALILVVVFEVPVGPETFFQDKLLLTYWMMEKLRLQPYLDFKLSPTSQKFLDFIRSSDDIRGLFDEDASHEMKPVSSFATFTTSFNLHAIGASLFVCGLTLAVIMNDGQEHRVAYITGSFFVVFCALGYTSGTYLPVASVFKAMILIWNPFIREPDFLIKLQDAAIKYHLKKHGKVCDSHLPQNGGKMPPAQKKKRSKTVKNDIKVPKENVTVVGQVGVHVLSAEERAQRAQQLLDSHYNMRWARSAPRAYTRALSHLLVTVELAAMMTPVIAVGVQWIMALCESHDTPQTVIVNAFFTLCQCIWAGSHECPELKNSCIMFTNTSSK